ncbi:MAG: hypothetical protein H6505_03725 [Calditrichaeota bacterium]|nr:hypothetical protein [Calditrichota bacterium]
MRYLVLCMLLVWVVSCTSPTNSTEENINSQDVITLSVSALPNAIPADGVSTMTIFVEYRINGQPVADSTRVILLNPMGTLGAGTIYTTEGIALDTLTADSSAGLGWLIAYADGLRDSTEIMFTSADAGPIALPRHPS